MRNDSVGVKSLIQSLKDATGFIKSNPEKTKKPIDKYTTRPRIPTCWTTATMSSRRTSG